jgi:hypothetical protein
MTEMTETRSLGVYELAYLAGGPRRAVEAAVVALVEAGVLRVTRPTGELVLLRRRPCPDLEAAVLDVVGFRGSRLLGTVCWRLRADVRLTGIGRRLQADGLLADGDGLESLRRRFWTVLSVTGAGRRALRQRRRELGSDGPEALRVALSGPAAMRDRQLSVALFNPPSLPPAPPLRPGTPADRHAVGGYYHHGDGTFLGGGVVGGGFGGGDCGGGGDGGGC